MLQKSKISRNPTLGSLLFSIILSLHSYSSPAQLFANNTTYGLTGSATLEGFPHSYRINFKIVNDKIEGQSVTEQANGKYNLQATIKGQFNKEHTTLSFIEYPLGSERHDVFTSYCFWTAYLTSHVEGNIRYWSGSFSGRNEDNAPCEGGIMKFTEVIPIPPPVPPPPPLKTPAKKTPTIKTPVLIQPVTPPVANQSKKTLPLLKAKKFITNHPFITPEKLYPVALNATITPASNTGTNTYNPTSNPPSKTSSPSLLYSWSSPNLVIDVWDGHQVDGDIISLLLNGVVILDHYTLAADKKRITAPLAPGKVNKLEITCHNVGSDPPNTPNLNLYDGDKVHNLEISGEAGWTGAIYINKE